MKKQERQIDSMLGELYEMYEQLYGQKYISGGELNSQTQFNKIVETFCEIIRRVKWSQEERSRKQNSKNYHSSSESVRANMEIREDIKRAEELFNAACKKNEADMKKYKKKKEGDAKLEKKFKGQKQFLEACLFDLNDVKQIEQGGVYQPPQYPTLQEVKKQLVGKNYEERSSDEINLEEEEFFDTANRKDQEMDKHLDDIIEGNEKVKELMQNANKAMDEVRDKVIKATTKTDALNERIKKDQKDLLEILQNYRRPNQLCLDITLVLMVLALIGVVINLIRTL